MRVPISWLREYVAVPNDAHAIAERLAMLGFPVASVEKRPVITGVVTGRIAELEKHPNADRLLVARVDVARDEPLTIATAATNVAAGQTIAVATIGARLPEITIEPRTMRGVTSQGMMISADELALPAEWFEDGIMQLDLNTPLGADPVELFGLATDVLDVEITTNRPDAMSVIGLARELAASYGLPLRLPPLVNPGDAREPADKAPKVAIESPDCYRFVAQRFDGIAVGPAPAWMRIRLALAGQRPINNCVDISNYAMLETGQPLHFYDADKVADATLVVRSARDGEKLVTLDGVERTLTSQTLVIADPRRVLGLAGVMGGAASEVTPQTTAILLEAADFNGARVRRTSGALGLRSEASARHEKTLAPVLTDIGAARAAQLLRDMGATAYPPHAFGIDVVPAPAIALTAAEVERLLGLALPAQRIAEHLEALGCNVVARGEALAVTPPLWRRDLTISADLVEEVARIEGYERIAAIVPSVPSHEISSAAFELESRLASTLAALGYREIVTHSLRATGDGDAVEVRNPLSEEQRFLRDSLAPGLLEYLAAAGEPARIFEIGDVFARDGGEIVENASAAFGFSSRRENEPAWRDSSFLRLKGDCEVLLREVTGHRAEIAPGTHAGFHPGKTTTIGIDGRAFGILGCIDPRLSKARGLHGNAYLCVLAVAALPSYHTPRYEPPSRFPSTYRDLALVLDASVAARDIERAVMTALGPLGTRVAVFDEYRGPQVTQGRKSLAVRVTLQRYDATITDEEADDAIAGVLEALREQFGATIRT
ncbi:MAG TPA: phenylalanine--tRNA ligase subunit beta [Candidatus Babeliales bacterium]|nr:phenylalanine--tRNA ligase subunit beta [Candidatus Babeliales bacterium]